MNPLQRLVSEVWTLFAVATVFTFLRLWGRIKIVGFHGLRPDDYIATIALIFYAGEVGIAYRGGSIYYGEMMNGTLPKQGVGEPGPREKAISTLGHKLHFSLWLLYPTTLWLLKASLLVLFSRLTEGLAGRFRCRIKAGMGILAASWCAILLSIFLSCRPFMNYFAPGLQKPDICKPAVSPPILWTCYALNVLTDLYVISVPLPMLWKTSMKLWKRIGVGIMFSTGGIIIVFATIRCVLIQTNPREGAPIAGTWAVRETFVAIVTTNFPMVFTLVRNMLGPAFQSIRGTSGNSGSGGQQAHKASQLKTFGSSGTGNNRKPRAAQDPTATNMLFSESEEDMVKGREPEFGNEPEIDQGQGQGRSQGQGRGVDDGPTTRGRGSDLWSDSYTSVGRGETRESNMV